MIILQVAFENEVYPALCALDLKSDTVKIIVACCVDRKPQLLTFDSSRGEVQKHEPGTIVQFGSIPDPYKARTSDVLRGINQKSLDGSISLPIILSLTHAYCMHDELMKHCVGGAFYGLQVDREGVRWQGDILYGLYDVYDVKESPIYFVSSVVRDDVLVVRSAITGQCVYFLDELACANVTNWRTHWWDNSHDVVCEGQFDYVVLLNRIKKIVCVVEMRKETAVKHLTLNPSQDAVDGSDWIMMNLETSQALLDVMTNASGGDDYRKKWKVQVLPFEPLDGLDLSDQ